MIISLHKSDRLLAERRVPDPKRKWGREVASVEAWVRLGVAEGWCRPVASVDHETRFRRRFRAELAMDCEEPYEVEVFGRYDRKCRQATAIFVDVITRCRKCPSCLKRKMRFWAGRAATEYEVTARTWLVTLTLRPEEHYRFAAMLEGSARPSGLATATGRFHHLLREQAPAITAYLDRVRKRGRYRYLCVAERHEGKRGPAGANFGNPHYHLLVHEMKAGALVHDDEWAREDGECTKGCKHKSGRPLIHRAGDACDHAMIRKTWTLGFATAKVCVDSKSAVYVCKYVVKDPMARIRASLGYGKNPIINDGVSIADSSLERVDPQKS